MEIMFLQLIFHKKMELKMYYLKKNKEYAITGMTIKADIVDSDIVELTDQKKLESLSKRIR